MIYYVYVLKSLKDKKRYVGITNSLTRRIKQHNSGQVFTTKSRLPLLLQYAEQYSSRVSARQKEKYFKIAAGRRFLDKITSAGGGMADT